VYAAIDFAYSLKTRADYSCVVVIGIAPDGHIYVLDIDRFKTDKIGVYYDKITDLNAMWGFRKLRAEVTAAQAIIVGDLKDRIRENGGSISIDDHRPNRHQGNKEERIAAVLETRYENQTIWHYKGGHIPALEEELILLRPQHDDLKDGLASAVEIAVKPKQRRSANKKTNVVRFNQRFGGVAFN